MRTEGLGGWGGGEVVGRIRPGQGWLGRMQSRIERFAAVYDSNVREWVEVRTRDHSHSADGRQEGHGKSLICTRMVTKRAKIQTWHVTCYWQWYGAEPTSTM